MFEHVLVLFVVVEVLCQKHFLIVVLFLDHLAQGHLQNAKHRVPDVMDQVAFLFTFAFGLFYNLRKKRRQYVLLQDHNLWYHDLCLVLNFLD